MNRINDMSDVEKEYYIKFIKQGEYVKNVFTCCPNCNNKSDFKQKLDTQIENIKLYTGIKKWYLNATQSYVTDYSIVCDKCLCSYIIKFIDYGRIINLCHYQSALYNNNYIDNMKIENYFSPNIIVED